MKALRHTRSILLHLKHQFSPTISLEIYNLMTALCSHSIKQVNSIEMTLLCSVLIKFRLYHRITYWDIVKMETNLRNRFPLFFKKTFSCLLFSLHNILNKSHLETVHIPFSITGKNRIFFYIFFFVFSTI